MWGRLCQATKGLMTWRLVLTVLVLGTIASVAGPFGTHEAGPFWRLLIFWYVVIAASIAMIIVFFRITDGIWPDRRPYWVDLFGIVIPTLVLGPVFHVANRVILGTVPGHGPGFWETVSYVAFVSVGVVSVRRIFWGTQAAAKAPAPAPAAAPEPDQAILSFPEPRLMRRLPQDFKGPVLRLEMDNHMLDVVGPEGRHRLRLRFADAVAEMEPCNGFTTHRSHWVSERAIAGAEQESGRISLVLINGDKVPVSRKRTGPLEEAGYLICLRG